MKVLVDAQKKLNIPLSNSENDLLGNQVLNKNNKWLVWKALQTCFYSQKMY